MPGFELRLLGGANLQATDGALLAGRVTHRHRLALLARLAIAAPDGVSRDKLVGLLWPDRDEASARHLLRAALHDIRQAMGSEIVPIGGAEVRLDPRRLFVDVHVFAARLSAGDPEGAVGQYRGPFLDGFVLDGADSFNEWVAAERVRLAALHEEAVERLATDAAARNDAERAAHWWRILSTSRPTDGRIALRLIDALEASGDPAAALAHASAHTKFLRTTLGVAPDAALSARTHALRRNVVAHSDVAATADDDNHAPESESAFPSTTVEIVASSLTAPANPAIAAPPAMRSPRRRISLGVGLAIVLTLAVTLTALASVVRRPSPTRLGDGAATVLAVAPFELVGPVARDLREGLATLLTANLDQVEELRVIPAAQVAARVGGADSALNTASTLRALKAELLVTGAVVQAPEGLAVTARVVDAQGAVRAAVEARGSAGDLATLIDRVSVAILRELWGRRWGVPEPRLAAVATNSAAALRAYLRGEMFLRAALWDSAAAALAEAIDEDSTFALAHMRLAEPYGWRYGMASAPAQRTLAAALRFADRLPPRDRMLLSVRRLHEAGSLDALDSSAALAERYPDDAEAQYVRADVRYHAMEALGHDIAVRAAVAFDTAMALDSVSARMFAHPLTLSLLLGDSTRFDRTSARLIALGGGSHMNVAERWDYALLRRARFGSPTEAARALTDRLRRAPPPFWQITDLLPAVERSVFGAALPAPELVLSLHDAMHAAYRVDPARVADIDGLRTSLLVGLGRMNSARDWTTRAWDVYPNGAPGNALVPVAMGYAPAGWLDGLSERINTSPYWQSSPPIRRKADYWQGMIALARGDTRSARAAFVRAAAAPLAGAAADSVSRPFAAALRAGMGWLRYVEGDTTGALHEVEAGLHDGGYDGEALVLSRPTRVWFTRMLARTPSRRAEGIDRIRGELMRTEGFRLAWWRLELSRALAAEGDAVAAAEERRRFDALWAGADSSARAAVVDEDLRTDRAKTRRVPR